MQTIMLQSLNLSNFKGIKSFSLTSDNASVDVFGDNATGKTSIFDAFNWLLFDKDSQNKKDFQLKTVDENGKELHGLDHEVSAAFLVNGTRLHLRKVFKEKWSKKRGQATAEFSGHTTDYYINDVPAKKSEYAAKVAELVEEDIFKLLTSPSYFNEQLHWQKRRELLLAICGDITDTDVINSNPDLIGLLGILDQRTIEEHKKMIAAKRSEINKKLDFIPARIDEVKRGMSDTIGLDAEVIKKQIEGKQERIMEENDELYRIQNGGEVQEKKQQLQQLSWKAQEERQAHQQRNNEATAAIRERLEQNTQARIPVQGEIRRLQQMIQQKADGHAELVIKVKNLLDKWHEVNKKTFDSHATTCPTCSQDLPKEQVQKAIEQFNLNKSNELTSITQKGKDSANRRDTLQKEINELTKQLEAEKAKEIDILNEGANIQEEITKAKQHQQTFEETDVYAEIMRQKAVIDQEIISLQTNTEGKAQEVKERIHQMNAKVSSLQNDLNKFSHNDQAKKRVEELQQEERTLAQAFEQIEQQLYLIEEFTRSKVHLLEEKINSKFQYARFKLFEEQINGGLSDTCKTLYKGVPYSEGLNNAARINVGLDIIQTLSQHFNVAVPIFVDNAEAVTKMLPIDNQVIRLVVSEADKELRVVS